MTMLARAFDSALARRIGAAAAAAAAAALRSSMKAAAQGALSRLTTTAWVVTALAGFGSAVLTPAQARDVYPSRVIHIIVPSNAGSGTDDAVRRLAKFVAETRGWNTVVDNRGGANGMIGAQTFIQQANDDYTLFAGGSSAMTYNPVAFKDLRYDPLKDFTPAARLTNVPDTLVVSVKSPYKTVDDLVAALRANPGKLFYGSSGVNRVATELFLQTAHLQASNVSYRSSPAALTDLIGGSINFMFVDSIAAGSMVRSGMLRALAFTSKKRLASLPDVPTMAQAGYPNFEISEWNGFFLRKGASPEAVSAIHRAVYDYYQTQAGKQYGELIGSPYEDISPQAMKQWIADQLRENRAVYARAGIKPE